MIDERARDLINEELDHELTADEQHELAAILESSPEAREFRDGLQALHGVLSDLPREDLPEGLHERITADIDTAASAQTNSVDVQSWPAVVRYGLAASLGLMVAVGFYEMAPGTGRAPAIEQMVGTMAPERNVIDRFNFDDADVRANASLSAADDATLLELRLDTETAIDIELDFSASGFRLTALEQTAGELESFEFSDHVLRARSRGRQRFAVVLERDDAAVGGGQAFVGLALSRDGATLKQGRLESN